MARPLLNVQCVNLTMILALIGVWLPGCTLSARQAVALRQHDDPQTAVANLTTLIAQLDSRDTDVLARALALESSIILAGSVALADVDPALYTRLVDLYKREMAAPRVHDRYQPTPSDRAYLQALAVHSLGELGDPAHHGVLIDLLADSHHRYDPQAQVLRMTLSTIWPRLPAILDHEPTRDRLITAMLDLRAALPRFMTDEAAEYEQLVNGVEARLYTLEHLTAALSRRVEANQHQHIQPLLHLSLRVVRHGMTRGDVMMDQQAGDDHVNVLLRIVALNDAPLASRARTILWQWRPRELAQWMLAAHPATPPRQTESLQQVTYLGAMLRDLRLADDDELKRQLVAAIASRLGQPYEPVMDAAARVLMEDHPEELLAAAAEQFTRWGSMQPALRSRLVDVYMTAWTHLQRSHDVDALALLMAERRIEPHQAMAIALTEPATRLQAAQFLRQRDVRFLVSHLIGRVNNPGSDVEDSLLLADLLLEAERELTDVTVRDAVAALAVTLSDTARIDQERTLLLVRALLELRHESARNAMRQLAPDGEWHWPAVTALVRGVIETEAQREAAAGPSDLAIVGGGHDQ